ncbi:porin family protein [Niastella caeni]|uniref:Porin family protein n=1 Tax=Niastella caeni TaxID=2569763 RepID=A0A4S8I2U0_9BACT|nr:outer membrane beta-barrel protein [Niastella caeni]THU41054.1 porin family protein [Niastella caeni]
MKTQRITDRLLIISLMFLSTLPFNAKAQERELQLDVNYSIGIPGGSFKSDAVDNASFRGWTANVMYNITDKISVGLGTGFQDFYQKFPRDVYKLEEGGDVSAVITNSIQTIPLLAQFQYRFMPGKTVQPYIGIGVGGNMIAFDQYLGEFENSRSDFKFAARPEVGLFIPFRKEGPAGIHVFGAYNYMPYKVSGIDNLNNWGAGIGVKFPLH